MQNNTYTLTIEELAQLIDKSFKLGKIYASDEINAVVPAVPVYNPKDETEYQAFCDKAVGQLHSVEAKQDILIEALQNKIFDPYKLWD